MKAHRARRIGGNGGRVKKRHSGKRHVGVDAQTESGVGKTQDAIVLKPMEWAMAS